MTDLDLDKFRTLFPFPQFDSLADSVVIALCEQAGCYITRACDDKCTEQLLFLMVAHLLNLRADIATGAGKALTSASEGGVSVSMAQPAKADDRKTWLFMTPFGQQYLALESKCIGGRAAAGLYFGALPEGKGFRKIGGVF